MTQDLRKLGKIRKNLKTSQNYSLVPSLPSNFNFCLYQQKTAQKQKLNPCRIAPFNTKTRVSHISFPRLLLPSPSIEIFFPYLINVSTLTIESKNIKILPRKEIHKYWLNFLPRYNSITICLQHTLNASSFLGKKSCGKLMKFISFEPVPATPPIKAKFSQPLLSLILKKKINVSEWDISS